jgi:hypothetical protein
MSVEQIETISLNDFRSWLQGVEDMQDDNWTPTSTQWIKIRQKIDCIEQQASLPNPPVYPTGVRTASFQSPQPSIMEQQFIPAPAPMPFPSPTTGRVSTFIPPPPPAHFDSTKTPDIDTSTGEYKPAFI